MLRHSAKAVQETDAGILLAIPGTEKQTNNVSVGGLSDHHDQQSNDHQEAGSQFTSTQLSSQRCLKLLESDLE